MDKINLQPINILLIEDNPGDIELVRVGFEEARVANNIFTISDGEEAMDYFDQFNADNSADIPDIVLLDINLPKVDGFEILHKIRSTPICKDLPVVILTSSDADADAGVECRRGVRATLTRLEPDRRSQEMAIPVVPRNSPPRLQTSGGSRLD